VDLISRTLKARGGLFRLVATAVMLAFGVNLLSDGASNLLSHSDLDPWPQIWTGLTVVAVVAIAGVATQFPSRTEYVAYTGFLPVRDGRITKVPYYPLAVRCRMVLESALSEDEELREHWERDPLIIPCEIGSVKANRTNPNGMAAQVLRESVEFVLLSDLSRHLSQYFNRVGADRYCNELGRDELGPLLSGNRILDLISTPVGGRTKLSERRPGSTYEEVRRVSVSPNEVEAEEVVWASDGTHIYEDVRLVLPKGMGVERLSSGQVFLKGKYLEVCLDVTFEGYSELGLDPEFIERYLGSPSTPSGEHDECPLEIFEVDITFTAHITWRGLFSLGGWRLYGWAESFAQDERPCLDGRAFLGRIGWPMARTVVLGLL